MDVDILEVARAVIRLYGAEAAAIMQRRSMEHLDAGEAEGAEFWRRVAEAVREVLR